VLTQADGTSTTVGYKGCKKNGRGITKSKTGETLFDCTFKKDLPFVGDKCLSSWSNSRYEGGMANGKYEGKGTFYWNTGMKLEGDWVGGKGKGLVTKADGTSYESSIDFS